MLATPEDRNIFRALLGTFQKPGKVPGDFGELLLALGLSLLGTPYALHPLDRAEEERPVINLRELDCFTFLENTVALAGIIRAGKTDFTDFADLLTAIRYRQGRPDGYASRLHYFTDWLHDNQRKGFLADITGNLGGEPWRKEFNYMTAHREQYPALKSAHVYRQLRAVEENCSARSYHLLTKDSLRSGVNIKNGDLLAIVTSLEGLDVVHVGLAIHLKKRLHLLHASRQAGKVVVSETTLYRYLRQKKSRQGIMVARAL